MATFCSSSFTAYPVACMQRSKLCSIFFKMQQLLPESFRSLEVFRCSISSAASYFPLHFLVPRSWYHVVMHAVKEVHLLDKSKSHLSSSVLQTTLYTKQQVSARSIGLRQLYWKGAVMHQFLVMILLKRQCTSPTMGTHPEKMCVFLKHCAHSFCNIYACQHHPKTPSFCCCSSRGISKSDLESPPPLDFSNMYECSVLGFVFTKPKAPALELCMLVNTHHALRIWWRVYIWGTMQSFLFTTSFSSGFLVFWSSGWAFLVLC